MTVRASGLLLAVTGLAALCWVVFAGYAAVTRGWPSDLLRQWVVASYVRAGVDPYPLAREILTETLGPRGLTRQMPDAPSRLSERVNTYGPPEATYPPPATALIATTIGALPPEVALWAWAAVNLVSAALVVRQCAAVAPPWPGAPVETQVATAVWLAIVSLPYYHAVVSGQFVLPAFACLLFACRPKSATWLAGVALGLALVKPSVALPFLILPLIQGRWGALAIAVAMQAALLLGLSAWLAVPPQALVSGWMDVARFFLTSWYGVQFIAMSLGWVGAPAGSALNLGALGLIWLMAWMGRRAPYASQFTFVCMASLLWTYHLGYDFVLQLPIWLTLLRGQGGAGSGAAVRTRLAGVLLLVAISNLAYFPPLDWTDTPRERISDAAFVVAMLSHPALFGWLAWQMLRHIWQHPHSRQTS